MDEPNDITDPDSDRDDKEALIEILADLKQEHRRVDAEIDALTEIGAFDMLKIGRMKKIKLSLKDQITYLENQLTPNIIA